MSNILKNGIKFTVLTREENNNSMKLREFFNIWKQNTKFKQIDDYNIDSYNAREYYHEEEDRNLYYDHDYDTYDSNEKLYGDHDDWEDYYDSIYN